MTARGEPGAGPEGQGSGPSDVPVDDFLAHIDLDDLGGVETAMDTLISSLESGYYLTWEAVRREEQGLDLSEAQVEALEGLIAFVEEDEDEREVVDEPILYINEIARPHEPWYESARKIVSHLLQEPFPTDTSKFGIVCTGWPRLVEVLEEHGGDLPLPEGATTALDAFPADLRHRLWLQVCLDALDGLGQDEALTLEREGQHWRIDEFLEALRTHAESVRFFGLSLEGLLERVGMPPRDREILTRAMTDRLGLSSPRLPLAEAL